ncbi:MAG: hypothetical protein U0793_09285 [Gemmataceae bacterium]
MPAPRPFAVVCLFAVTMLALDSQRFLHADEPKEPVQLRLLRAGAERSGKDVFFFCDAVLINNTGAAFNVRSSFFSAFDGLRLVVFAEDGKKLLEQSFTAHQSPFSVRGSLFPVGQGENKKTLRFPVSGAPGDTKTVQVVLIGTLPGTDHGVLCSDLARVTIAERAK